jgi:uncharacterized phage protein gp47/JayE
MAWDIPTPTEIADQASTDIEEGMAPILEARGITQAVDARSEYSVFRVFSVVIGLALYPVYLFFSWVLDQLFVDRCSKVWLAVHARIWGVERVAAIAAVGAVTFEGAEGTSIPAETTLALSGSRWRTTAAATVGSGGTVSVSVTAITAGAAGNRAAGAELALETPILGLTAQSATVDAGGITGGADLQSIEDWRAAVIAWIREPGHGGSAADYAKWAKEILAPARVAVHKAWVGAGTVGVVFAMGEYDGEGNLMAIRSPTTAEVATMQAGLDERGPVTATVVALAAEPLAIDVTVAVSPYTTVVELAIEAAAAKFFLGADVQIAGKLHRSRLSERLSRAAGEQWHVLATPTVDPVPGALQFPVLGTLTVTEAT